MLTNDQMTPNRFAKWHTARRKLAWMQQQWQAGRTVYLATPLRVVKATQKHAAAFKATRDGLFMQSGKQWLCMDGCRISTAA